MSLTAFISSSLPFENGYYQQYGSVGKGATPIPVVIQVFNSGTSPVSLKEVYLINYDLEEPVLSLGDPDLKRRGVSYAPANNVIPAATTQEATGTIPVPSGSNNNTIWIALPFQSSSEYTIGSPPLVLGPYIQNYGFYGINNAVDPPFLLPVYPSTNNSSIVNVGPTPIFSGAVNLTQALNFTSSVFTYDPNVSQGSLFGQLNNFGYDPPTSSLANQFTYEWWSNLRSYGVPWTGGAQPTNNYGTIWKTFGFPFLEGAGAQIGYLENGELYIMMEQDFTAPVSPAFPPYVGVSSSAAVPLNTWTHQAITRNAAGLITFWINGTASGTGTRLTSSNPHYVNNFNLFGDNLSVPYLTDGGNSPYENLIENTCDGYFMNLQFTNTCKYTGNFTPPTGALGVYYSGSGGNVPVTGSQTTQGSASFNALFIPQINALNYYPNAEYQFNIGAVLMRGNDPNIITSSTAPFRVQFQPPLNAEIVSPYRVWSLANNKAPPENTGFDFQLSTNIIFINNESVLLPFSQMFYSSSDTSVAEIVENTEIINATTSSVVGGFTQLSASGGGVSIKGTGSVEFYAWLGPISGPPIASASLEVVDALPLGISVYPQNSNLLSGSYYQYSAYLLKSNGAKEDITNTATWATTDSTLFPISNTGLLEITGSTGQVIITAVSGGLLGTANASVINRAFEGIKQ